MDMIIHLLIQIQGKTLIELAANKKAHSKYASIYAPGIKTSINSSKTTKNLKQA